MAGLVPTRPMTSFGFGAGQIGKILVINLDRQPGRWRRAKRELSRFRTIADLSLADLTERLTAVDARDGRAVAATSDVDPIYRMGDQLFVQPDPMLEASFGHDEPIRMTRQEIAVARSHIECWKAVVAGNSDYVMVLEDDIRFGSAAEIQIDRGWKEAVERSGHSGPELVYLSYSDAGGSAERNDIGETVFRPGRGLWFLSGYVLSRTGAEKLLRAMPVVGPVDLWMNYRFRDLRVFALNTPVIHQSADLVSDNSYSVLPYLARAGIVDHESRQVRPAVASVGPVMAWSTRGPSDHLAMALSMLGFRVCTYPKGRGPLTLNQLQELARVFDVIINAPITPDLLVEVVNGTSARFLVEEGDVFVGGALPAQRTLLLSTDGRLDYGWDALCTFLDLPEPAQAYPVGTPRSWRTFEFGGLTTRSSVAAATEHAVALDDSPWVLPPMCNWHPRTPRTLQVFNYDSASQIVETVNAGSEIFNQVTETFPGNLAVFTPAGVTPEIDRTTLTVSSIVNGRRPYGSGALASKATFHHGRFEAEIKAAKGAGLVTGFFLHRHLPRQEIDIELLGGDPEVMLANVYYNPGDDGAAMDFGYRGAPAKIALGFDTSEDFHLYAIEWRPDCISWWVDNVIVHERRSWDPTPIPHLEMRLHANAWVPRSADLAGRLDAKQLPAQAAFRNVAVWVDRLDR